MADIHISLSGRGKETRQPPQKAVQQRYSRNIVICGQLNFYHNGELVNSSRCNDEQGRKISNYFTSYFGCIFRRIFRRKTKLNHMLALQTLTSISGMEISDDDSRGCKSL
uniref:Uncharacterized protein n=1 Tax=Glossina austeni TaxID=7395 RepID=A0A1A9VX20_GLOAU